MAQDLTVNIKTTSDVPQAMEKAKTATVSFSKQVEDIQKKFSTAFKDIFLGFTAPMILVQGAISFISKSIEEAKRNAKEGLDLLATGESRFNTTEESRAAAFFKRKKELEDEKKLVEAGKSEVTRQILKNEGGMFKDFELPEQFQRQLRAGVSMDTLSQDKEVQRLAMEYFNKTAEGRKLLESLGPDKAAKSADFKSPEGFGNVVGVGANPVMEAMNAQLEEAKKQTELLGRIAATGPSGIPLDFTKIATT